MSDKLASADELLGNGTAQNTVIEDGVVKVRNQVSGNFEEYTGQRLQDPGGNYLGDGKKGDA